MQRNPRLNIKKQKLYLFDFFKLQEIKSNLTNTINLRKNHKSIDSQYRSKTLKLYKQKLKKVFSPSKMEGIDQIKNFNKDFNKYVEEFQKIQNLVEDNQPYVNEALTQMTKKDTFQSLLTLQVDQLCELAYLKNERYNMNTQNNQKSAKVQQKMFPRINKRKINIKIQKKKSIGLSSLNSPLFKYQQLQSVKQKTSKHLSRTNTNNSLLQRKNSLTHNKHSQKPFCTQQDIIKELLVQQRSSNCRYKLIQFNKIMLEKYGNDVFSSYFQLNNQLTISRVVEIINLIYSATNNQKLLIQFLMLDLNKDGFICQEDLFNLSKKIKLDSVVNKQIYKIVQFFQNNNFQPPSQSKLPIQLLKTPKRQIYLRLFQKNHSILKNVLLQQSENNGLVKHFCMSKLDSQRHKVSYDKNNQKKNKVIKINFEIYSYIFRQEKNLLISDLLSYFTGKNEIDRLPNIQSPRKNSLIPKRQHNLQIRSTNRSLETLNRSQTSKPSVIQQHRDQGSTLNIVRMKTQLLPKLQTQNNENPQDYEDIICSLCSVLYHRYYKNSDTRMKFEDVQAHVEKFRSQQRKLSQAHTVLKSQF